LTELEPTTADEVITAFGLGYGVDASDTSSYSNRHGRIRTVLPSLKNIEEREMNRRDKYKQEISNSKGHKESVSGSVSDIVGGELAVTLEAEYHREYTRELTARGTSNLVHILVYNCIFGCVQYFNYQV